MRSLQVAALALAASQSAYGYVDTSPFFMFSTSDLLNSAPKLSSAAAITSEISRTLSLCPSDHYIIVSQPGVTARDYSSKKTTPTLAQRLSSKGSHGVRSSVSIPDVVGEIDTEQWRRSLQSNCKLDVVVVDATAGSIPAYASFPKALHVTMPAPASSTASEALGDNDALLAAILDMLPSSDYTVLYTTSPSQGKKDAEPAGGYVMDSEAQEMLHIDLKRDLSPRASNSSSGNTTLVDGALFERYQFFTPGIFQGLLVGFILLSILYVGISALSSLSVTYGAFDKEQGQLANKSKAQ
ncbi:uncharacterized protein AB675_598 [Cyphellophora attinorum]|uniref:Protein BIG1 n=1 Tax=Cyphellophora attinorum TaxID=1664694 RepID=A0A0N1HI14_9EURO|nr:uncharacterized protein AB675_598 [Phialophora attinorum]KPI45846.1 hypothetical protein AB675_598 [Phialophora attinorum]